jgi:biotin carboxyl carrier protein
VEFRQKALSRLRSPEELDLPVRFARPQGLLALTVALVVLAGAAVWAVGGSVSSRLTVPGVLTHGEGGYVLQSPLAGQVVRVRARTGDLLAAGAPLLDVRTAQGVQPVRLVAAGRVTALPAGIGAVIGAGTVVADVERVGSAADPLVAVLYPVGGTAVPVGAAVEMTVQSVPAGRYGVLRGTVAAVGREPQSAQQIAGFLGDAPLGAAFAAHGAPVAVMVRLGRGSASPTGYSWSSRGGPPYPLSSLTPVSGSVLLPAQRPLDWLLP